MVARVLHSALTGQRHDLVVVAAPLGCLRPYDGGRMRWRARVHWHPQVLTCGVHREGLAWYCESCLSCQHADRAVLVKGIERWTAMVEARCAGAELDWWTKHCWLRRARDSDACCARRRARYNLLLALLFYAKLIVHHECSCEENVMRMRGEGVEAAGRSAGIKSRCGFASSFVVMGWILKGVRSCHQLNLVVVGRNDDMFRAELQ